MRVGSLKKAAAGVRAKALTAGRRAFRCGRNGEGSTLVEMGLMLPILLIVLIGIIQFGITFGNYLMLTNGTVMGAQALSICRGLCTDPCQSTYNAFEAGAPSLQQSNLTFTIEVNPPPGGSGSPTNLCPTCAKGVAPSCAGTLPSGTSNGSGAPIEVLQNYLASVTVTYPCNLVIFGINFAPSCTLTAQTSQVIQ